MRKKIEEEKPESKWSSVSIDIKKSAAAILLVGLAVILILASFGQAGPIGNLIYKSLSGLFGWGYYLLPAVALIIAFVFLLADEIKFLSPTFFGAAVLIVSALGLIDIVFPGKAGFTGNVLGLIENPFGRIASLVIVGAVIGASLLVTLNIPLKIKSFSFKKDEEDINIKEMDGVATTESNSGAKTANEEKEVEEKASSQEIKEVKIKPIKFKNYVPPPLALLKATVEKPTSGDLRANANIIKRTFDSFGIRVEMGEINIGPKVTRYTLKPAEGIKLARITTLNQDLSLALAAHPLRIEAPIPGRSLVGIEVPNKAAAIVRLGSLMAYPEFAKNSPLSFILGRDVNGQPIAADIEKMPHCLISGSTGSGKSILIHSIIVSLLYKNSPEALRMILIDPKRVELSVYNGIPHLTAPVITDGRKAINVFRWAVQEMEQRYETLLKAGARDIGGYNNNNKDEPMPYLLIVVDELADLMASHGREIESTIVRLAQMARATGIHLLLSTQRPSVEVITGLIKANITSRVALQVASQIDSRTILDMAGAEKLLGGGDMLFISYEFSKPKRIQGAYISEEEVSRVAKFVRDNNKSLNAESESSEDLENQRTDFENFEANQQDIDDDLYDEAVTVVCQAKKASASLLQRRLKVGYARAARLLDLMEGNGLIGPGDGAKPREVFLDRPSFASQNEFEDIQ